MITDPKDQETIVRLYFEEMYTYDALIKYFKKKYKYAELKTFLITYLRGGKND